MVDRPQSQLPQDPEYWEDLARRIRADGAAPLAAYAAVDDDWTAVIARRAPWLVAASTAAMLVLWLLLPPRDAPAGAGWIETAVSPRETAGTLISSATPPSIDALMVQFPPATDDEEKQQ